ncbi:glycosyltransferase family 2 protein [Sulfolobus sp. S-194]|uniref:glycosyltransferase family 2 protein n=1 Tax=Sulfolobus sp. S-194 TaxID=2512240 RepID=UPI001437075A|nr:glycosyltransferase family 2 protein [Sulfolobus sp. S-194]QIW24512.1 glycosyltransferase family 2 protein [Sulfolobus sp. S-194]
MVKVSVAIPTYNRKEKLRRLLYSLEKSTFKDYEIIVVDDASTDGTEEMIKNDFSYVKYIKHDKPTLVAKSRNDAIEASEGDFIFFIDDDNVIEPNTIEKLLKFIENNESLGTVAPVTCYYSVPEKVMYAGAVFSKFMRRTISLYSGFPCKSLEGKVIEVDVFANSYMFRKEAIMKAGLIPWKRIPWNGEDGYLQYRIKKLGYRNVTLGSARVYHDVDPKEGVKRYNEMRLYYAIRSKIVFHRDLDSLPKKITFYLSLPVYVGYYLYIANKAKKGTKGIKAVIQGLIDGIINPENIRFI